ncbi:MAG: conjugal transfer protein TraF [gamma proteobacterium symbiont of Clathrolucina costata]
MSRYLLGFLILTFSMSAPASDAGDGSRWLDRKAEGYFWYKSEPEKETEQKNKEEPAPPITQETSPSQEGPAPLSSAWIRANIQGYLDAAIDNPTAENVAAYLYIQKYAMDKSFAFMDASQEVTLGHSAFDEINRRPTATFANRKLDEMATSNNKSILEKVSSSAGIFFFMDGSEATQIQTEIIEMLERNYQFDTIKIATDSLPDELRGQSIRQDNGHAAQMGISSLPAIVLMRGDGVYDIVSQAPVSYPDLQKRILVGAKRLGVISDQDFNSTRPIANISQNMAALPGASQNTSSVPIPAEQIIRAFNGGMYQ